MSFISSSFGCVTHQINVYKQGKETGKIKNICIREDKQCIIGK